MLLYIVFFTKIILACFEYSNMQLMRKSIPYPRIKQMKKKIINYNNGPSVFPVMSMTLTPALSFSRVARIWSVLR